MVHTCEVRHGSGGRLRIVAVRENRRALLCDFEIRVIAQRPGEWPKVVAETRVRDFARALGAEGLFGMILERIAAQEGEPLDENGVPVPLPEKTAAEWAEQGNALAMMAAGLLRQGRGARAGAGGAGAGAGTVRDASAADETRAAGRWRVSKAIPVRVQRSRRKGARLVSPNGLPVMCVTRPGPFGNPFRWTKAREAGYRGTDAELKAFAVEIFRQWLAGRGGHGLAGERERLLKLLPRLRGCNLACYCDAADACHADVLLELANQDVEVPG